VKISDISKDYQVIRITNPASAEDTGRFKRRYLGADLSDYIELMECSAGFDVIHSSGGMLSIFSPSEATENDRCYGLSENFPGSVPLGSDGNSRFVFLWINASVLGVWLCDMSVMSPSHAIYVASNMLDLLSKCDGVEMLTFE